MARTTLALSTGLAFLAVSIPAQGAATYVQGLVPDWDQPYLYAMPNGPGPDPTPGAPDPFNAWCAPAAASNLLGHWEDVRSVPLADGSAFPGTPAWLAVDWHDRGLDGGRPPPGPAGAITDVGWFMDTNNIGDFARGNVATGHLGTYVKDIHAGLGDLLNLLSTGWTTGARGKTFALGQNSSGAPALPHPNAASAFAEVVAEVNANRTLLIAWSHWNISIAGHPPPPPQPGIFPESEEPTEFYNIDGFIPADPWENDEIWEPNPENPGLSLGHVTTVVGYIPAGDPDDPGVLTATPTDWVIVHDNVAGTPRNVIVPLMAAEYTNAWVANINANTPTPAPMLPLPALIALAAALAAVLVFFAIRARRQR